MASRWRHCADLTDPVFIPQTFRIDGVCAKQLNSHSKPNLHYTRDSSPKRVTSGGAHLRGLAPKRHSSEETSKRWRHCADLTDPKFEPQISRTDSVSAEQLS